MECEDRYAEYVSGLLTKVRNIEDAWVSKSAANAAKKSEIPSQVVYSSDYRAMGWRASRNYFFSRNCDRCGSESTKATSQVAGCRHNGDGYGSEFYFCEECGLFDWESYDEA